MAVQKKKQKKLTGHEGVISPAVEHTLTELQTAAVLPGFYLAGGTGLALQLGHRRSLDLDFFSSKKFDPEALVRKVQGFRGFALIARDTETLHVHVGQTKVSFLGYSFPVLFPFGLFLKVKVADARDIACMKISAIAGRGTKRDFFDLYTASQQYGLPQLIELFKKKFARANYSVIHVLKSMTYFEDAEKEPVPHMLVPTSWEDVKEFFTREAPRLL